MRRWTWRLVKWGIAVAVALGAYLYITAVWSASDDLRERILDAHTPEAPYDIEVIEVTVFHKGRKRSSSRSIPRYGVTRAKQYAFEWGQRAAREMRGIRAAARSGR